LQLKQIQTQKTPGGLTDIYRALGTYIKSFYTVMFAPSCAKISVLGERHDRVHHHIASNAAYPKILRPPVTLEKTG